MAIVVSIKDDDYLVDVGFGAFAFSPVIIQPDKETNDLGGIFKIELFDKNHKVVKKKECRRKIHTRIYLLRKGKEN